MNDTQGSPFFAETSSGLTQLRRHWAAEGPKAAVLLVHGIGEHSGRYDFVGSTLAAGGYDVLAADNKGFGQTGGARAYVDSFDDYLDDIEALVLERRSLGLPVVLFGHSLGGLMAATYLVSHRPPVDLGVLSAPALAAVVPAWQRLAAPVTAKVKPDLFIPTAIDVEVLSRDVEVQEAYANDPLVVKGATAGLGHATFTTMVATTKQLHLLRTPTYVLHGVDDELVPPSASAPLQNLPNVTRRLWAGLRHECMNEPEKGEVLGELLSWLDEQTQTLSGDSSV